MDIQSHLLTDESFLLQSVQGLETDIIHAQKMIRCKEERKNGKNAKIMSYLGPRGGSVGDASDPGSQLRSWVQLRSWFQLRS